MPEKPLLLLPSPHHLRERAKRSGGFAKIGLPSRRRQAQRLTPRFDILKRAFDARRAKVVVDASGSVPEEVLVLETVGSVEDFLVAARNVPGMEWLGEIEQQDIPPDDDFFALDSKHRPVPGKTLSGRMLLAFSNHEALEQMLSLWGRWQKRESIPRGLGKWADVFGHLRDIRPWGVTDRLLETGVLADWAERLEHNEEILPCEIELWFRRDLAVRMTARKRVSNLIASNQGRVISEAVIPDIAYHALLVELPVTAVSRIIEGDFSDASLVHCEQIQFFRATGQFAATVGDEQRTIDETTVGKMPKSLKEPVVALLDGLPLQNHRRLAGRLVIDDPDDFEADYLAQERRHGTAMASLIIHGDLEGHDQPLSRPLYVRPIMRPNRRDWNNVREEIVPENVLVADIIHRAVRRIFEGEHGVPPVAPNVCVINLSVAYKDRLFDGPLSSLARLLDWLAWKYQVLFVVSGGNHSDPPRLDPSWDEFSALAEGERQEQLIKALAADSRHRRLRSPAEAINVLTVGAVQSDHSGPVKLPRAIEPFAQEGLPSPINAQGMGFRRAIKPEILAPGGRVVLMQSHLTNRDSTPRVYQGTLAPGQKVAAPGKSFGSLEAAWYTRGTSNAAALTTRAAAILYDVLRDLRTRPGGHILDGIPPAIWLKTLLVHAADWGPPGDMLDRILRTEENSRQFKEYITRFLGYGSIDEQRVLHCTQNRITALSGGSLGHDQAHIHRFPLPPSLRGQRVWRRLTITLSWLTPVNPNHQRWRRAALWFDPPRDALLVQRQQADWRAVRRGTVQHEVLEGRAASAFVDGDNLEIQVNCTADAGTLESTIPYALATTLEVARDIGVSLYDEVRTRVHAARIRVDSRA